MEDLKEKLSEFLSNPQNLEQIKSITGGLLNQNKPSDEQKPVRQNNTNMPDLSMMPVDTINILTKIMPMLSSVNKENDNTRFLQSLRPLLKEKRQKKLDEASKMLQMMQLIPILKMDKII